MPSPSLAKNVTRNRTGPVEGVDEVFNDSSGSGEPTEAGLVSDKPTDTPDNLGCPKVCVAGPYEPDSNDPWIALVQRGGCQFVDKAREAQRLGAKAIVVGGDNPDLYGNPDTLVNMYSPGAYMPARSMIPSGWLMCWTFFQRTHRT
jgi:hypothetical protein